VNPADERIRSIKNFAEEKKVKIRRQPQMKDVKEKIVAVAANEFAFGDFKKNGRQILNVNQKPIDYNVKKRGRQAVEYFKIELWK